MTVVGTAGVVVDEGRIDANTARCEAAISAAASAGVQLLVLPECALTGYYFRSADEVHAAAIDPDGDALTRLRRHARQADMTIVVGFLERVVDEVHNSAAVLTPDGATTVTRKTHLPHLGADRFAVPGDRIGPVIDTPAGRVGVAICYDFRFPETCRALALDGADIVAVPVNWSTRVKVLADHFVPTRAVENGIFVVVADRIGAVDGVEHLGASRIVAPDGRVLAARAESSAGADVTAQIDVGLARDKATVFAPASFEIDLFADRRPALYGALVHQRSTEEEDQDA